MTVADFIKQYMKVDASVELIWEKAQGLATEYGIDLEKLDEPNAQFLAGEIDNIIGGGLAVPEGGAMPSASAAIAPVEEKSGKATKASKKKAGTQAETLKPAVINLRNAIEAEAQGLAQAFDKEFTKSERRAAETITARAKDFNSNVVGYVAEGLEGYKSDSESFRGQIESIIGEAFSGFLDS